MHYLPTYLPTYVTVVTEVTVVTVVAVVTVVTVMMVVSSKKNHATSPQKNHAIKKKLSTTYLGKT